MATYTDACPYCGQANLTGEDARKYCACKNARQYRKILEAMDNQSSDAEPMKEIDANVLAEMKAMAHLICAWKVYDISVKLADGTTVKIGRKVSRTARLRLEEKVDE